ncbi:HAD-IB family phosphatase [Candidatus Woesearchaeota archaeon]|nr:HAD-IB family phosphatase [Candidatus Woesearchaeota archaeon]
MKFKLVCFDVDGTLVDNIEYSWQLFHDHFKIEKKKREEAKEKFFTGKISYREWAEHDINLWKEKGATKKDFFEAMKSSPIALMKGARETIAALKEKGMKLAIISGTINVILEYLLPDYEELFDDIFLSRLFFDNNGHILNIQATEYDMKGKAEALKKIAARENLSLDECAFIGDHHNDVEIAKEAGLAMAFNAKSEELVKVSDVVVKEKDLKEILPYLIS